MPERGRHRAASLRGLGTTSREKRCSRGPGDLGTSCASRENTQLLCPQPVAPCSMASISCHRAQHPAGTLEGLHQPGPGTLFLLCPQDRAKTCSKAPLCQPQPCKPQPSSSKHPTWKEQHHHSHNRSPAMSAQGKGQPQTPKIHLRELSMEPNWPLDHQISPAAIANPGWALPAHPQPRSGTGREIEIPLAKVVPVLSALFFSSKDTKEFKHRA